MIVVRTFRHSAKVLAEDSFRRFHPLFDDKSRAVAVRVSGWFMTRWCRDVMLYVILLTATVFTGFIVSFDVRSLDDCGAVSLGKRIEILFGW